GPGPAVKLCRFVKPVPLVLTANTVPLPALPPCSAVPYRVLPDRSKPPIGAIPSVLPLAVKLCRVLKPVPSVLMANTVPLPEMSENFADQYGPPAAATPYRVLPDKIKPSGAAPSLLV